jgi:glucose/mannose-6-phosphate isomerase
MQLDSHKTYATLDVSDIRFGIEHLPEQMRIGWEETRDLEFPTSFSKAANVVVMGMGGSALGAHMLLSSLHDRLKVPFTIVSDYQLPGWANEKTIVILSSFSGNTEEVLAAANMAVDRDAMIIAICAGGELAKRAKKRGWGLYQFDPGDLAKQPRLGTGFSFAGMMGVLERAKLLRASTAEIDRMRIAMGEVIDSCAVDVKSKENPAKTVAKSMNGTNVLIIAAEHLVGTAHMFANSINETAKQFATYFALPELNHHLLEGLTYPKAFAPKTVAFLVQSALYHERTQKRVTITADMLEKQGIAVVDYVTNGSEKLEEVGEVLQFASFVSYYLGMLNGVRPEEIPFVDAFKEAMGK